MLEGLHRGNVDLVEKVKETQLQPTRVEGDNVCFCLQHLWECSSRNYPRLELPPALIFPPSTVFLVAFTPLVGIMKFNVI